MPRVYCSVHGGMLAEDCTECMGDTSEPVVGTDPEPPVDLTPEQKASIFQRIFKDTPLAKQD